MQLGIKILGAFWKLCRKSRELKKNYTVKTQQEERKNFKSLLRTHKQSTSILVIG